MGRRSGRSGRSGRPDGAAREGGDGEAGLGGKDTMEHPGDRPVPRAVSGGAGDPSRARPPGRDPLARPKAAQPQLAALGHCLDGVGRGHPAVP